MTSSFVDNDELVEFLIANSPGTPLFEGDTLDRFLRLLIDAPVACMHEIRGGDKQYFMRLLNISDSQFHKTKRCLRVRLGSDESEQDNIPIHYCRENGYRQIYHLSGDLLEGSEWLVIRLKSERSSTLTDIAYWESMVRANPDSVPARRMLRGHRRKLEDTEDELQTVGVIL